AAADGEAPPRQRRSPARVPRAAVAASEAGAAATDQPAPAVAEVGEPPISVDAAPPSQAEPPGHAEAGAEPAAAPTATAAAPPVEGERPAEGPAAGAPAAGAHLAETADALPPAPSVVPIVPPKRSREPAKPALVGLTLPELEGFLARLGQPAYRARQIYEWIFRELAPSFEAMTNLPKNLRTVLAQHATVTAEEPVTEAVSGDGQTTKVLMRLHDGNTVETVLMEYDPVEGRTRHTVCVSSQAGCAVGCPF